MATVNTNIRFLRKQKGLTQGDLANEINITRSSIGAYEEGRAEPKLDTLLRIANFFSITLDQLVSQDLSKTLEAALKGETLPHPSRPGVPSSTEKGSSGPTQDTEGKKLRVLSITVDSQDRENIELVPEKAAAGYLNGYADPEYLEDLPRFQLPMLPQGSYRAFEITGDSMLPLTPGTVIIGEYVENWNGLRDGEICIVVSGREGIVCKRVFNKIEERQALSLHSDNPSYPPFDVEVNDVQEIWRAKAYISMDFPDNDLNLQKLASIVMDLQQEVIRMKGK